MIVQIVSLEWLVGIEPAGASRLRALLADAAASLEASASRVQRLLDEAGTTCGAPIDIRGVARTCVETSADLSRRMLLVEGGGPGGRAGTGLSLRGPDVDFGPRVAGCAVGPAPLVVTSCNPPGLRPEILGRPGRPLVSEVLPAPSMQWSARLLGPGLHYARPAADEAEEEPADEEPDSPPRPPVTDQPRDEGGNVIGGTGPGKGDTLSGEEAEAVRDYEARRPFDQGLLASARRKITGQEKYAKMRNRQKR